MPVHPVKGQPGCYQWGESGKVYCGDGAKEKAEAQGRAAYASGYKSKAEMQMQMPMESKYQEGDDRWWLFHKWEVRDDKTLMTYQDNGRFKIWVLINPYHFNGRMEQNGKINLYLHDETRRCKGGMFELDFRQHSRIEGKITILCPQR